jgi:LPS O-antigen subunit length determinant protein (WzzB/FepE family)
MKRKTVLDFFRVVYRRKKAVGVIMAVAVGSAIVLSLVLPKMYEATVTVFPPKNLSGGSRGLGS